MGFWTSIMIQYDRKKNWGIIQLRLVLHLGTSVVMDNWETTGEFHSQFLPDLHLWPRLSDLFPANYGGSITRISCMWSQDSVGSRLWKLVLVVPGLHWWIPVVFAMVRMTAEIYSWGGTGLAWKTVEKHILFGCQVTKWRLTTPLYL